MCHIIADAFFIAFMATVVIGSLLGLVAYVADGAGSWHECATAYIFSITFLITFVGVIIWSLIYSS